MSRFKKGVFWSIVSIFFSQPIAVITSIAVARLLGFDSFGQYSLIRSTILMLGILSGTGLGIAATRHMAEFRYKSPERAGNVISLLVWVGLVLSGVAAILTYLLASELARFLNDNSLECLLILSAPLLVLNSMNGIYTGALIGMERYKWIAVLSVLEGVITFVIVLICAWFWHIYGAILGMVVSSFMITTIRYIALYRATIAENIKLSRKNVLTEFRILRHVALPAVIVAVSIQPFEWLGRVLIVSSGVGEVGIFSAAQSWAQLLTVLPAQVTVPSMAILASLYSSGEYKKLRKIIWTNLKVVVVMSFSLGLLLIFMGKWILGFYGSQFISGAPTLWMLVLAYFIGSGTMVFTEVLIAVNRAWLQSAQKLIWGVTMMIIAFFLSEMGAIGLATAYMFANLVFLFMQAFAVRMVFAKLNASN